MNTELIIVSEYCNKTNLDPNFFEQLEETGLITIYVEKGERYIPLSQLGELEKFIRLYYDLSINLEGIAAIRNLQDRMKGMQNEINRLRQKLRVYESDFFENF